MTHDLNESETRAERIDPALAELKQSILQKAFAGRFATDYRFEEVEA
jgi:hypothetical protein